MRVRIRKDETGGDDDFAAVFDDLYPAAVRVAFRILGDQPAAEDVAAEALARAYARWAHVGTLPYRDAWVMKVAGNLAIDVTRKRRDVLLPDRHHGFEDGAALRVALASALAQLPTRQREAIVLRHMAGHSESEVSAALGISTNSVKTHVQRGMASLRARLGENSGSRLAAL